MALSVEEMTAIWLEVMVGKPSGLDGKEADEMRRSIRREKAKADREGYSLEMPFEW